MEYLKWNDILAGLFFNEEMAGKEVLLYVDSGLIEDIASKNGTDFDDFLEAIKQGPGWVREDNICRNAYKTFKDWRFRGDLFYPPYIAYLCFFVLAGGYKGDFAPQAYYPRLRSLLGEGEDIGQYPYFDRMDELWDDLERWSKDDKDGNLGIFTKRIRGRWRHVGIPLSQLLLTGADIDKLPEIFAAAQLDPTDVPSTEYMGRILVQYGSDKLSNKTLKVLQGEVPEGKVIREALLEFVLDQLESWDGQVTEKGSSVSNITGKRWNKAYLKLCLKFKPLEGVSASLKLKSSKEIPENGLNLKDPISGREFKCQALRPHWSRNLQEFTEGEEKPFDPSILDWSKDFELIDEENGWKVVFRGARARLFVRGITENLPDWIEVNSLDRGSEHCLAISEGLVSEVEKWGHGSCEGFKELDSRGFPQGWRLFSLKNPRSGCSGLDILSMSKNQRVKFEGGIKIGSGNTYLLSSPPNIRIENSSGKERVFLNGTEIKRKHSEAPVWEIPPSVGKQSEKIYVRVIDEGNEVYKSPLNLSEAKIPLVFKPQFKKDYLGNVVSKESPGAKGPSIDPESEKNIPPFPKPLPLNLADRILLIGQVPGQVANWPYELPKEWKPVWALAKVGKKQWKVYFCGDDLKRVAVEVSGDYSKKDIKRWKEAVWVLRKRTLNPPGQLNKLWKEYKEVAKHL